MALIVVLTCMGTCVFKLPIALLLSEVVLGILDLPPRLFPVGSGHQEADPTICLLGILCILLLAGLG